MTISLHKRKKVFIEDLMRYQAKLPGGTNLYRKKIKIMLFSLVEDLAVLEMLPVRLKNFKPESAVMLVEYWKKSNLEFKTIRNKLGILRRILSTLETPIIIKTNKELDLNTQVNVKKYKVKTHIYPFELPIYPNFFIKEICLLQFLFGLKFHEALKIEVDMVGTQFLEVPRSISFNDKDRLIPIESIEQKEFVLKMKSDFKDSFPIRFSHYKIYQNLFEFTLSTKNIVHKDYFRHCYIRKRFIELSKIYPEFEVFEKIKTEVGYSRINQVRMALLCQENS